MSLEPAAAGRGGRGGRGAGAGDGDGDGARVSFKANCTRIGHDGHGILDCLTGACLLGPSRFAFAGARCWRLIPFFGLAGGSRSPYPFLPSSFPVGVSESLDL